MRINMLGFVINVCYFLKQRIKNYQWTCYSLKYYNFLFLGFFWAQTFNNFHKSISLKINLSWILEYYWWIGWICTIKFEYLNSNSSSYLRMVIFFNGMGSAGSHPIWDAIITYFYPIKNLRTGV